MKAYLKRHLFDGERLRRRTMEEFAVAMRSGRLIAFVGSLATKDARYPDWSNFLKKYADLAEKFVVKAKTTGDPQKQRRAKQAEEAIAAIKAAMPKRGAIDSEKRWDNALTSLSVIKQILAYVEETSPELQKDFEQKVGALFRLKDGVPEPSNAERIATLRIDRVITLNYDLEFEWLWMTTAGEKKQPRPDRHARFIELLKDERIITCDDPVSRMRILADGRSVISDIFSRKRTDRLIEFAVGSPDYEAHILHLHGVAISPETMVISQWDYNRQYRRSGVSKLPFEHGLRVLFAGNPILFIGVGMSERDVTATLEQIVSDHPDRRIAPAFLIWNAPPGPEKDAHRFRWLHRFGVLTIFDDEILPAGQGAPARGKAQRFADSISNLVAKAVELVTPFPWVEGDFRSIRAKLVSPENKASGHYDIWPPAPRQPGSAAPLPVQPGGAALPPPSAGPARILLFTGRPGVGKGALARELRDAWHKGLAGKNARSMIINASFVFEIESVFSLLSGLANDEIAADEEISRRQSLGHYLTGQIPAGVSLPAAGAKPKGPPRLLIVINGMERFFSPGGQPLSTELDGLLRAVVRLHNELHASPPVAGANPPAKTPPSSPTSPDFKIVILGTGRVRNYFGALHILERDELIRQDDIEDETADPLPSVYFRLLRERFKDGGFEPGKVADFLINKKSGGDSAELRRHFLGAYLQTEALQAAGATDPDLCFDILTVMAQVGQPIEDAVLFHAPRIQKRLATHATQALAVRALVSALDDLRKLELIIPRGIFEACPEVWYRYGLHRSVLTEMRDRVGVPLSDSKLSGGFNISLFAAQPVDGYSPEAEIHEELDMLVDWLIGAFQDEGIDTHRSIAPIPLATPPRAQPHASACLRAALAVVRNYYSTAALLTLDVTDQAERADSDGPLARHAERLDRLIAAARENALARRNAPAKSTPKGKPAAKGDLDPAPFYPDDLVWLLNERGVVKLTQGDLYEARYSFDEALRLNEEFVEFSDTGNNWRHLMLNQLHVDIERARLDRAEQRIAEIGRSLESLGTSFAEISQYVVDQYGQKVSSKSHVVDPLYEHDVILTVGLIFGYRGLCLHLGGEFKLANEMFQTAVNILENIGEQRAYAMFQRYFASLKAAVGQIPEALEALRLAIASSEATRQTDIAHHARITAAWHRQRSTKRDATESDAASRATLIRTLQRSLRYAEAGEMHRVRIEAGLNLARIKFDGGDYDSALERVADAMATATRYGMSLRKISLRILMGQILMRRGDHTSGANLVDRAMRNADRVGYQGAVGLAQRVQALEENPLATPRL